MDRLKTCIGTWYGANAMSRDTFRALLLDPTTSDEVTDHLRDAARGMIEARNRGDLAAAGADLAAAVQRIGPDRFARYLSDASRRSLRAVGDDEVPGVKLASVAGSDMALGLVVLFGIGIGGGIHSFHSRPRPAPSFSPTETPKPLPPTVVPAKPPSDAKDPDWDRQSKSKERAGSVYPGGNGRPFQ